MPRPICAFCGKAYGLRASKQHTVVVEIGQPIPPFMGNVPVVKEEVWPPPGSSAFVPMDPMPTPFPWRQATAYTGRKGFKVTRTTWDGETYRSGYDPFCKLRCAHLFALAAYKAGHRMKAD